jgi:hypothetical protein
MLETTGGAALATDHNPNNKTGRVFMGGTPAGFDREAKIKFMNSAAWPNSRSSPHTRRKTPKTVETCGLPVFRGFRGTRAGIHHLRPAAISPVNPAGISQAPAVRAGVGIGRDGGGALRFPWRAL